MPEVRERVAARADVRESVDGYEYGLLLLQDGADAYEGIDSPANERAVEDRVLLVLGMAEKVFLAVRPPA